MQRTRPKRKATDKPKPSPGEEPEDADSVLPASTVMATASALPAVETPQRAAGDIWEDDKGVVWQQGGPGDSAAKRLGPLFN